jgi:hypothetical protein
VFGSCCLVGVDAAVAPRATLAPRRDTGHAAEMASPAGPTEVGVTRPHDDGRRLMTSFAIWSSGWRGRTRAGGIAASRENSPGSGTASARAQSAVSEVPPASVLRLGGRTPVGALSSRSAAGTGVVRDRGSSGPGRCRDRAAHRRARRRCRQDHAAAVLLHPQERHTWTSEHVT